APVDVKGWTGAIDIMPSTGSARPFKLELVPATKPDKPADPSRKMMCGQVVKAGDALVEMIVVPAARKDGKEADKGFLHDHGAPYFRATPDVASLKDAKTGVINFKATAVFTLPGGETRYALGFQYPERMVDDVLGRFLDKEFGDVKSLDHEHAVA